MVDADDGEEGPEASKLVAAAAAAVWSTSLLVGKADAMHSTEAKQSKAKNKNSIIDYYNNSNNNQSNNKNKKLQFLDIGCCNKM